MTTLFAVLRRCMTAFKPMTVEAYLAEAADPKELEARIHRVTYGQWPGIQNQLYVA